MATPPDISITPKSEATNKMLRTLGFPIHRIGFHHLCIAIPLFSKDFTQSLNSDIYPNVAVYYGFPDHRSIEKSIRDIILYAWRNGDPDAWNKYFPNLMRPPSNRLFISTLADRLK